MIVAGVFADVAGLWRGQVLLRAGKIVETRRAELGPIGTPRHTFGDDCLIFAGMGDIHTTRAKMSPVLSVTRKRLRRRRPQH